MQHLDIKTKAPFPPDTTRALGSFGHRHHTLQPECRREPLPRNKKEQKLKVRQKEGFSSIRETLFLPAAATQISICFRGPRVDQQACATSLDRGYNGNIVLSGTRAVFIQ